MPATLESATTLAADEMHVIDTLQACHAEASELRERLAALQAMKSDFVDEVFERVHSDYVHRLQQVEEKAAPMLAQARDVQARVQRAMQELAAANDSVHLDQQELELRRRLGEFDDAEHARRLDELQAALDARSPAQSSAQAMNDRLQHLLAGWESVAPAVVASRTAAPDVARENNHAAVEPAVAQTRIMSMPNMPPLPEFPARAVDPSATMSLRVARLVPQNPQAGRSAVPLPPRPVTLGADPASDIQVRGEHVERAHARITVSASGYTLTDLGSKLGTQVNAQAVRQRLLKHEDLIQIGDARYVFREG